MSLFSYAIEDYFREFIYMCEMAEIYIDISHSIKGISILFKGYNHKFDVFIAQFSELFAEFVSESEKVKQIMKDRFQNILLQKKRRFDKTLKKNAYKHLSYYLNEFMITNFMGIDRVKQIIDSLSFEDYWQSHIKFFQGAFVNTFITGNLLEKDALHINKLFVDSLNLNESKVQIIENRPVQLHKNTIAVINKSVRNPKEKNNAFKIVFQLENTDKRRHLNLILCDYLNGEFYSDLRTDQQLGYIVYSSEDSIRGVLTHHFVVQSSKKLPSEISLLTHEFLKKQREMIHELSDEKFKHLKDGQIAIYSQEFQSLKRQAEFYSNKIHRFVGEFEERQNIVKNLLKSTKQELIEFFDDIFFTQNKILEIHISSVDKFEDNLVLLNKRRMFECEGDFENIHQFNIYEDCRLFQKDHILDQDKYLPK
jgi:insulysin